MKQVMRPAAFMAALLAGALAACSASAEPPVWVIRDRDSTITLFGSVHMLPPGADWRPAKLRTAIAQADDVWFELPLDAASQSAGVERLNALSLLPEGQKLSALMPAADAARLKRVADTLNQPLDR